MLPQSVLQFKLEVKVHGIEANAVQQERDRPQIRPRRDSDPAITIGEKSVELGTRASVPVLVITPCADFGL